jgi:uncharacterized protein (TIGR03083 family)
MYDQLYRESRQRVAGLVTVLGRAELSIPVAACPQWTVRDVFAHLAGTAESFATGRLDGAPSESWTAKHVADRAGRSIGQIVADWEQHGSAVERIPLDGPAWLPVLHDVLTHEADIRAALGAPRPPADAIAAAWPLVEQRLPQRLAPLGTVSMTFDTEELLIGDGDGDPADLAIETTLYEFWRGYFGRRSESQLRSWVVWGDATAFAHILPCFPATTTDLIEPA